MSSVQISGNASGTGVLTIAAPNTNSSYTQTLPAATGNVVIDTATQTLTNKTLTSPTIGGTPVMNTSILTSGTAVAYTSFTTTTYNDFLNIPSWVKRITVMFKGLSFSASAQLAIQIGSGSVTTSGYTGSAAVFTGAGVANASYTAGFAAEGSSGSLTSATLRHGLMILTLEDASTNTWVASGNSLHSGTTTMGVGGGSLALSGALDRVRITTIAGTATVTAGSVNILYE